MGGRRLRAGLRALCLVFATLLISNAGAQSISLLGEFTSTLDGSAMHISGPHSLELTNSSLAGIIYTGDFVAVQPAFQTQVREESEPFSYKGTSKISGDKETSSLFLDGKSRTPLTGPITALQFEDHLTVGQQIAGTGALSAPAAILATVQLSEFQLEKVRMVAWENTLEMSNRSETFGRSGNEVTQGTGVFAKRILDADSPLLNVTGDAIATVATTRVLVQGTGTLQASGITILGFGNGEELVGTFTFMLSSTESGYEINVIEYEAISPDSSSLPWILLGSFIFLVAILIVSVRIAGVGVIFNAYSDEKHRQVSVLSALLRPFVRHRTIVTSMGISSRLLTNHPRRALWYMRTTPKAWRPNLPTFEFLQAQAFAEAGDDRALDHLKTAIELDESFVTDAAENPALAKLLPLVHRKWKGGLV